MKQELIINKIIKENNRINYIYEARGKWSDLLVKSEILFLEFDTNIEAVPDSIAIIPLLCNILPICWVFNLNITIDELDDVFYSNIDKIKDGYIKMYPEINFGGNLDVKKTIKNDYITKGSAVLFSGGVDAFNTLICHIDEKPALITVWGSDIPLSDEKGWSVVDKHHKKTANDFDIKYHAIKTNFRSFLNCNMLSNYISKRIDGSWWHEFQHGIGLIGLTAPLAYIERYKIVYIASSFTIADLGNYTCASDPTIDNHLKHSSCNTIHDGYEFNRQDKIHNICNYVDKTNKSIKLRVCWESTGGKNCCECEKCCRTMLGILTEKNDPNKFGFNFNNNIRKKMMKTVRPFAKYNHSRQYSEMQRQFIKNYKTTEIPKDLLWFSKLKIINKKPFFIVLKDKALYILKKIFSKIKNN